MSSKMDTENWSKNMANSTMPVTKIELTDLPFYNVGWMPLNTDPISERDARMGFPADKFNIFFNRVPGHQPITNENMKQCTEQLEETAAKIAPDEKLDVIAFACTTPCMLWGDEKINSIIAKVKKDVPIINPALSSRTALQSLNAKTIGVVTSYEKDVNDMIVNHFQDHDFGVEKSVYLNLMTDYDVARVSDSTLISAATEVANGGVDALFLCGCCCPVNNVIKAVEDKTGVPVVTSNQSLIWMAYKTIGLKTNLPHLGMLTEN